MTKWIYARNNAYDLIAKIEDGKARVLTENKDFPNTKQDLTEIETTRLIEKFMKDVVYADNSNEWEEYDEGEILKGNEILWEKEIKYYVLSGKWEKGKPWTQEDTTVGVFDELDEAKHFAKRWVGESDEVIIDDDFVTIWYAEQDGVEIKWNCSNY